MRFRSSSSALIPARAALARNRRTVSGRIGGSDMVLSLPARAPCYSLVRTPSLGTIIPRIGTNGHSPKGQFNRNLTERQARAVCDELERPRHGGTPENVAGASARRAGRRPRLAKVTPGNARGLLYPPRRPPARAGTMPG